MSNIIPPMLSSSPPPVDDQVDEEEDDDFGDFRVADLTLNFTDLNTSNDCGESEDLWATPLTSVENFTELNDIPNKSSLISNNILPNGICGLETECEENHDDTFQDLNDNNESTPVTSVIPVNIDKAQEVVHKEGSSEIKEEDKAQDITVPPPCEIDEEITVTCEDKAEVVDNYFESLEFVSNIEVNKDNENCDTNMTVTASCDLEERTGSSSTSKDDNLNLEFGEFSEFVKNDISENSDCEFSTFADFKSETIENNAITSDPEIKLFENVQSVPNPAEDDFDDFECADFQSSPTEESNLEDQIQEIFTLPTTSPTSESEGVSVLMECLHSCLDDSSSVWGQLKELETSHAMLYQWANSTANKMLLSSLNIDSRNILFGPRWNSSVPRFAANLGFSPLEPVRASETSTAAPTPPPRPKSPTNIEEVVPAAQFDWTGSGLTNPLDCLEKEVLPAFTGEQATPSIVKEPSEETTAQPQGGDILIPTVMYPPLQPKTNETLAEKTNVSQGGASIIAPTTINQKVKRKEEVSPEAFKTIESFPDLSFLSARKLMCTANENMNRWKPRP